VSVLQQNLTTNYLAANKCTEISVPYLMPTLDKSKLKKDSANNLPSFIPRIFAVNFTGTEAPLTVNLPSISAVLSVTYFTEVIS